MSFQEVANLIIFIAAIVLAVTNIFNFVINIRKSVHQRIDTSAREHILEVINSVMPDILMQHDLEVRKRYLEDRERYLREIEKDVVKDLEEQLSAVDAHEEKMLVFSEVLKELLRERIMDIYSKNKYRRKLEEHERLQLDHAYRAYKAINGNSYIDEFYQRMIVWEVIPDDYHDNLQ